VTYAASRLERAADDEDRALCVGGDDHEIARMRLVAPSGMDPRLGARERVRDEPAGVVVADRGEEQDLGRTVRELVERDAAADAWERPRLVEVQNVARTRQRGHGG
jgi:hypothetical protein